MKNLSTTIDNNKYINNYFKYVPAGLVIYEWRNNKLTTLFVSEYYQKKYGIFANNVEKSNKEIDYSCVYKQDVASLKQAINTALNNTHYLEHVFRIYNKKGNGVIWLLINAVVKQGDDDSKLVYASYTDITKQKKTELKLKRDQKVLSTAINASINYCYEYDPIDRTAICLTSSRFYNFPKKIEHFPYSRDFFSNIYDDDRHEIYNTLRRVADGHKSSSCEVRVKNNDQYVWYSFKFDIVPAPIKNHDVIIITICNISSKMAMVKAYEGRLNSLVSSHGKSLCLGIFNLSQNSFTIFKTMGDNKVFKSAKTFDDLINIASNRVMDAEVKKSFIDIFSRKNLMKHALNGESNVYFEHLYQVSSGQIIWVKTVIEFVPNPATGDMEGIGFAKSINIERLSDMLLKKTLQQDFIMAAIFYEDADEYYLFDVASNKYCSLQHNFWDFSKYHIGNNSIEVNFSSQYFKDKVLNFLKAQNEYTIVFDNEVNTERRRLELRFSYLDKEKKLILATVRNITDNILIEQLRHESRHDLLTGLYNRKTVFAKCQTLLNEHKDVNFVMLHFDIKHFRLYNSFFGEKAGDQLLCDVASGFRKIEEAYPYIAYGRIDSDVFCIFFPYNEKLYNEHIHNFIIQLPKYRSDFRLEASIGIYIVKNRNLSIEAMFSRASIAARDSKEKQGSKTSFFNDLMEQSLFEEQQVINEMQEAINQEQLKVYLQPKYSLRSKKIVGAEALVRWEHPVKGIIYPGKFIPILEKNGLIGSLDRYMWEHVCILLRKWLDEGKKIMPVSVNVSRVSLYNNKIVEFLESLVKKYNIDPHYLELELTESAYMDDPMEMKKHLIELKNIGFTILMDDFGSGYSSLNILKELPFDYLKLDMKFLSSSNDDKRGEMVLMSVIRMAKLLDLPVIAEGVEKDEQAKFLESIGCEFVQGFLFAKPVPIDYYEKNYLMNSFDNNNNIENKFGDTIAFLSDCSKGFIRLMDKMPNPLGILEFRDERFVLLRFNRKFITEFNLADMHVDGQKMFKEKLTPSSYIKLIESLKSCASLNKESSTVIDWCIDNNQFTRYIVNIELLEKNNFFSMLIISFTKDI